MSRANSMELLPSIVFTATINFTLIFLFTLSPLLQPTMSKPYDNATDLESLLAFKAGVADPYGILANNWTTGASFCTWIGIRCGRKHHQRVVSLTLKNITLQGTISPHIGNLSFLSYLSLGNNSLSGPIPSTIGRLQRLVALGIQSNQLSGTIPSSIFNITSLVNVSFHSNNLSGSFPSMIDHLPLPPRLQILSFTDNHLIGRIPSRFAQCSLLQILSLSKNELSGNIPPEFGNLTELTLLYLGGNRLTGTIPASIGNLTKLVEFDPSINYLEGSIPEELGSLPDLQYLSLASNRLTGSIPMALSNASNLNSVQLQMNNLTGTIPTTLGSSWPRLTELNVVENWLTGGLDFITSLTNCRYLTELAIASNEIEGDLPNNIGNLSTSLELLDFSYNHIKGEIPAGFGNLSGLIGLYLESNELTGEIPSAVSRLKSLQQMFLCDNRIGGSIPPEIGLATSLSLLNLSDNRLSGSIPYSLGNISGLANLALGGNRISSNIPNSLWSLADLVKLDMSKNTLDGSLPMEMGNLKSLDRLDLSKNRLSGNISSALGELQILEYLDLSSNFFHGQIPTSVKGLVNVKQINLSYNSLSGAIPKSLANLSQLNSLDLSNNKLEGQIPEGRVFSNLSIVLLKGNRALCGALKLGFSPCPTTFGTSNSHKKLNHLLEYILFPIASTVVLLSCFCFLLIFCRRITVHENQSEDNTSRNKFQLISYHELVRATNNFSDANLLGRGSFSSVFKAYMDDGSITAVKALNVDADDQTALRSFEVECNTLSKVRHRNLVKIISTCINLDFKSLVLEFMPNGSLEQWLYSDRDFNLLQILNIMVDVSLALEYLHHHHPQAIVHCDLKPSNVLLDQNMTAHVSDFGISKLLLGDSKSILSARAPGTYGYMAPEYGSTGRVSRKIDVYSFGILLLETLTRKKPTDAMFDGELSLRQWVSEAYPASVREIVDPFLLQEDPQGTVHQLLLSLTELGLQCSRNSPKERFLMKDVAPILQKLKMKYLSNLPSAQTKHDSTPVHVG